MTDACFTFLGTFLDAIEELPDDVAGEMALAIIRYGIRGEMPENPYARMLVSSVKAPIDAGKKMRDKCRKAGTASGEARREANKAEQELNKTEHDATSANKEKEKEKEKVKDNKGQGHTRAGARFVPPTVEEVAEYCRERGNDVDPKRFVDHYTTTGWMRGNNHVKDWRACVRTWEQREDNARTHKPERPPNQFHNFDERKIDYDAFLGRGTG